MSFDAGGLERLSEVRALRAGVLVALLGLSSAACPDFPAHLLVAPDPDGSIPADAAASDISGIDGAVDLPVSADLQTDAASGVDAMVASGPFGSAVRIEELVDAASQDDDPTLTGDMLEMYFKRAPLVGPEKDIFVSTRASLSDPWSTPVRVDELSSDGIDNSPEISFDGLTIHFSSDLGGNVDAYRSDRATRNTPWSTPERVLELSSAEPDYAPTPDRDDLRIVLTRDIDGSLDLLEATRGSTKELWGSPVLITELNTPTGYEADGFLGESGLRIFYVSDGGGAGRDVVSARRSAFDQPFVPDPPIGGLNTSDEDEDPWLSEDLTTIFFVRDTGGAKHIYTATRPLGP